MQPANAAPDPFACRPVDRPCDHGLWLLPEAFTEKFSRAIFGRSRTRAGAGPEAGHQAGTRDSAQAFVSA
jgi:hypothetical protein